jgi:glutathione S-transferase
MRLHYHPLSPYSRKVVIAIQHRGDAIEMTQIQLGSGALKRPEYLAMSPFGKMPTLETPEGPLFESTSIIELLEDQGPRKLLPEARQREARHWDRISDHYLLPPYATLFWEAGTAQADAARQTVKTAYEVLGARLETSPFLAGDTFTLGDIGAAIAVDGLAHEGVSVPNRLRAWLDRCHAIEAMRASREAAMPFIESTRAMRAVKR